MNVFAVPAGRYVSPFEDVYRGQSATMKWGPLLGERAVAASRFYREGGAEIDRTCKELPTHIGVELSFMSFLCQGEAAAILRQEEADPNEQIRGADSVRYRALQSRFLREHLNAWFPQLSRTIQANAKSTFYRGLARITEEFLARDAAVLSVRSGSERFSAEHRDE